MLCWGKGGGMEEANLGCRLHYAHFEAIWVIDWVFTECGFEVEYIVL